MSSENSSELTNNYLQTPASGAMIAHISQIPGLSPTLSAPPEERSRGRRVGVLEGDSDYVKLAKQGGHKGLLWHEETINSKQQLYKPPEWFCNETEDDSKQSERQENPGASQLLEPPFATDNMSAWERGDSSNGKEKENADYTQEETVQLPKQYYEASKFKRIVFDKKPPPVDMSKLLSFGYADDN